MSTSGLLFRNGPWVDISDYNDIIKIFRSMGYSTLRVKNMGDCWNVYISNIDILDKIEEEEDWENVSGTMILYFFWDENHRFSKGIVPGIDHSVTYFLYIEELMGRSLVILEFLYRYFERFPTDVFSESGEYYYTKKDIDKMHAREEPDESWPFMDPATF